MKRPNKLTLIHIVIPALIILFLLSTAYTTSDDMLREQLIFGSMIVYFPILFFVQGFVCALLRENILLSLGISSAMFMISIFIQSKSFMSMLGFAYWMIAYLLIGLISYGLTWFIQQVINDRRTKKRSGFILTEQAKMLNELSKVLDEQQLKENEMIPQEAKDKSEQYNRK